MQHHSTLTRPPLQWNPPSAKHGNPYPIPASECANCSTECAEPTCSTSNELTSQCTDQCVVITCSDPEHANLSCTDVHSRCDLVCDSPTACVDCDKIEDLFQCCNDLHPCYADQAQPPQFQEQRSGSQYNWENSLAAALCDCGHLDNLQKCYLSTSATSMTKVFPPAVDDCAPRYSEPTLPPYIPSSFARPLPSILSPYAPVVSTQTHDSQTIQYSPPHGQPLLSHAPSPSPPSVPPLMCMWGDCQAQFASLSELIGHVNLAHLRLSTGSELPNARMNHAQTQYIEETTRMPCLWGGCTEYLQPRPLAGTAGDDILSNLADHLFQEHLGLHPLNDLQSNNLEVDRILAEMATSQQQEQGRQIQTHQQTQYGQGDAGVAVVSGNSIETHKDQEDVYEQEVNAFTTPPSRTMSSAISSPALSAGEVPAGEGHLCLWKGCGKSFETCNDLMTHMSVVHVGSGKPQYDCLWERCMRNGNKGFSSKQKICRHLQSHTGHRPFQCPECLQNFSEAATLHQHRRRHTQEKPYKCDFPGCGKSFAITGALTIHKRVHNGQKPFKCSYCGRGFAESSNLSKHLRTHTGERPYVCTEPGCGKAFARPDQLTRHIGVHRKRAIAVASAEV